MPYMLCYATSKQVATSQPLVILVTDNGQPAQPARHRKWQQKFNGVGIGKFNGVYVDNR